MDNIDKNIKNTIIEKYGYDGELLNIFTTKTGKSCHKWEHYIPLYDFYFSKYRNKPIRFLEIGVQGGGSLCMWRKWFGNDAIIFGIDIDPNCKKHDGVDGQVRIGSQTNTQFLKSVIEEMGGVDLVLDDGSHNMPDIKTSIDFLFPLLNDSGLYMVEDLHTSYWERHGGGYHSKDNFSNFVKETNDDIHHWYHHKPLIHPNISQFCSGIHIHDSIVVFEKKNTIHQPMMALVE